ncbi:MAG TPA: hypothetical protein VD866_12510 [Urbifossiella sp.]|nr:hypothetical protein [Urbifossiella sp.]
MSDSPARRPQPYLDNAALAPLVREMRRTGRASDELGRALMQIAGGVWDRYHFTADRDDFVGDVLVHLLGTPLERVDPKKNIFSYFTTCAIRFGLNLRNKAAAERRRFEAYAADVLAAGTEVPGDE